MLSKKTMIFTLDALLAISIAILIASSCFVFLSKTSSGVYHVRGAYLISSDSLTVLEKSDALKEAITLNSTTSIEEFIGGMPSQVCGSVTVYDSLSSSKLSVQREGCTSKNLSAVAYRVFVDDEENIYYAKMESWYR